jgi:hypothetical protein
LHKAFKYPGLLIDIYLITFPFLWIQFILIDEHCKIFTKARVYIITVYIANQNNVPRFILWSVIFFCRLMSLQKPCKCIVDWHQGTSSVFSVGSSSLYSTSLVIVYKASPSLLGLVWLAASFKVKMLMFLCNDFYYRFISTSVSCNTTLSMLCIVWYWMSIVIVHFLVLD